ncbi:MAG TPA: hypothetical protein VFF40_08315 [Acidimicrobiia bacterium]|nr:hypothetical protein [Acidimicrobiia bacterium]
MATFVVEHDRVELRLSFWQHIWTFHGDITFPRSAVTSVRTVADPWTELRGIRSPGTGIPRVLMLGTKRGESGKEFVIARRHRPAVVVELEGQSFRRLVISIDDPEAVARDLRAAA